MAVIEKQIDERLVRHYSDIGKMLVQSETGALYTEAIDAIPCRYSYEESAVDVEDRELDAEEALAIITGGDGNEA